MTAVVICELADALSIPVVRVYAHAVSHTDLGMKCVTQRF
jgi:hypothetical protein